LPGLLKKLDFKLMTIWFMVRDLLSPPGKLLEETGLERGFRVLDYGCGPGSFSMAAARLVGPRGKVYALDINPLAVRNVERVASRKGLRNIETILSDCATGLEGSTIDVVLLFDTYHIFKKPDEIMEEIHRVLKPESLLLFRDHHMKEQDIILKITAGGLFTLKDERKKTYIFSKR